MVREPVTSNRQRRLLDTNSSRSSRATVELAELTTKARKGLDPSAFVFPATKAYPIPDESHARNALARVSQFGTPAEQAKVRSAVAAKFPNIGKASAPQKKFSDGNVVADGDSDDKYIPKKASPRKKLSDAKAADPKAKFLEMIASKKAAASGKKPVPAKKAMPKKIAAKSK